MSVLASTLGEVDMNSLPPRQADAQAPTLDLRDPACTSIAGVGGKAVNLHRMIASGLPVPGGFVVTTAAYRSATAPLVQQLRPLFAGIREASAQGAARDGADLAATAARVRAVVGEAEIPDDVRDAVLSAYAQLSGSPRADAAVAVRSSATAEDLADASFAGQQDTYLNVIGERALLDAVRACWASLWTDRAVAYRASHDIDPGEVCLAVVVQRMVDAQSAGVMFTVDPVTGSRSRTVIDANHGLGESVVSGEVDPDRYVVDTARREVLQRTLGNKQVAVRALPGGGVTREERSGAGEAVLSGSEIAELTALGVRVAELFGEPQDTEWAQDPDGTFWLTQARPVTTLFPPVHPVRDSRARPGSAHPGKAGPRLYLCASLAQGLTRPITPLGRGAFALLTASGARFAGVTVADPRLGAPFYAEGGERVFGDLSTAYRNPVGRRLARFAFSYMEARSAAALQHLEDDPAFALEPTGAAARLRSAAHTVSGIARFWRTTAIPSSALIAVRDPDRALREVGAVTESLRHALDLPADASPATRLDAVESLLASPRGMVMPTLAGYVVPGFVGLALASRLLRGRADGGELQTVLRGLPNNVTTQMDLELWDLSRQLGDSGAEPTRQDLEEFLARWGDRAVAEIDLGMPRWREQPEHLLGTLRNYALVTDERSGPGAVFDRGRLEAEATIAALLNRAGGPVRRAVLGFALDRARRLIGLREAPKFALITILARVREQFLLIGAHLVEAGQLDRVDDVFFLDLFSLRAAIEGLDARGAAQAPARDVVVANRAAYERELRRRHIPRLLLSDGTEVEALAAAAGRSAVAEPGTLTGTPASAGVVSATARVITDPVGAHLAPGEILVAPSTDPGWTPLFLTAGGLVMEMGGSNSHGAVVAREYGIPAVVGVPNASATIRTGQQITVDGAAGVVRLDD